MVIHGASPCVRVWVPRLRVKCGESNCNSCPNKVVVSRRSSIINSAAAIACACACACACAVAQPETLSNIPQTLSAECASPTHCTKAKIQRPKSRKAESCTIKCVTTCIRGGEGSPGEGPLNVRSLVECSDICNLIGDGDDGP